MSEHTRIKICGIKRTEDAYYVNREKPDYTGFVFYPPSHRNLSFEEAQNLRMCVNPGIKVVGVFVNADIDFMVKLVQQDVIDLIQLHGSEDEDTIRTLRRLVPGTEIIKAILVKSEHDIEKANRSSADYVLVDHGLGTGGSFDWSLLEGIRRPYILAGGLTQDTVEEAVKRLHPWGVDVSSGVEVARAKNAKKIERFCKAVRRADKTMNV